MARKKRKSRQSSERSHPRLTLFLTAIIAIGTVGIAVLTYSYFSPKCGMDVAIVSPFGTESIVLPSNLTGTAKPGPPPGFSVIEAGNASHYDVQVTNTGNTPLVC